MQRKRIGSWMWALFSPLLLSYVISLGVELIVVSIYGTQYMMGLTEVIETQEQMYEHVVAITEGIMPYATQMGAVAALITIPFLMRMVKKDRVHEQNAGFVSNKVASAKYYPLLVVMSVAVAVGLNNILLLLNISEYSEAYQQSAELLYTPSFPVQIVCLGIIYPIMEEYIFRGVIYRRMRVNIPVVSAISFSAVMFGLYHGNSVQFIYGALAGVMLSYFYEKFGSLRAPILGHMVINIVAVILTEFDIFTWMFAVPMRMAIITIICAAVGSSMFIMIRNIDEKPEMKVEEMLQNEGE